MIIGKIFNRLNFSKLSCCMFWIFIYVNRCLNIVIIMRIQRVFDYWVLIQKFDMNAFYSLQKNCFMSYPVLDKSKTNSSFHLKCHLSWVATTATHSKSFEYFIIVFDDQDKRQERSYVIYDGWSSKIWFSWVSFHLNYTRIVNPKMKNRYQL